MCILVKEIEKDGKPFLVKIIYRGSLKECKAKIVGGKSYKLVFTKQEVTMHWIYWVLIIVLIICRFLGDWAKQQEQEYKDGNKS